MLPRVKNSSKGKRNRKQLIFDCSFLSVTDNPIVQLSENGGTLFAGRKAVFHCIASGLPPPTAKWLMNGKELRNGDLNKTITLERKTDGEQLQLSLHISDVDFGHAGIVTCEAENKYCMKRRSIQVSVSCKFYFSCFISCIVC